MNTLNDSGIKQLDKDIIAAMFNAKCSTLENLEEYGSGMFSTQQKLIELKGQLLDFVSSYKNRNSFFYIFFNRENEQNLKIVATSVLDEPDELTKRFAIVIHRNLTGFEVKQLSLSSKILTIISRSDG
jgi:hypothetical protein